MAKFVGKGPESLLEELVYGADIECAVIVKDIAQHTRGLTALRIRRIFSLTEEIFKNTGFHLVRGLVGESYGENVAIGIIPL